MARTMTTGEREQLRERVRDLLSLQGMSQKAFEERHALPAGTLTRVFGGRRVLDAALEAVLVEGLGTTPAHLFEPTRPSGFEGGVDARADDSGPSRPPRRGRVRDLPLLVLRYVAGLVFRD